MAVLPVIIAAKVQYNNKKICFLEESIGDYIYRKLVSEGNVRSLKYKTMLHEIISYIHRNHDNDVLRLKHKSLRISPYKIRTESQTIIYLTMILLTLLER